MEAYEARPNAVTWGVAAPRSAQWLAAAEAVGVFLSIVLYIWWLRPYAPAAWTAIPALLLASHAYRGETPAALGFRRDDFRSSARVCAAPLLALAATLSAAAVVLGTVREVTLPRAAAFVAYYCLWGLVQQYALNGYFTNRIRTSAPSARAPWVALGAATLFGLVHTPNLFLMGVTFVTGYLSALIYLRYRNLYVLGIAHGLIGALLYWIVPVTVSHYFYVGPRAFQWQSALW